MERKGESETKKAGMDVAALAEHSACSSDKDNWQLQIQAVAIAQS